MTGNNPSIGTNKIALLHALRQHFIAQMFISVIERGAGHMQLAIGFDGGALVVDLTSLADDTTVSVQMATDYHVAGTHDQRMLLITQTIDDTDIESLACRNASGLTDTIAADFVRVMEITGIETDVIAINPTTANIGDGACIDTRIKSINQTAISEGIGRNDLCSYAGDFSACQIIDLVSYQRHGGTSAQCSAVGDIAANGNAGIAARGDLASIIPVAIKRQTQIGVREYLTCTGQTSCCHLKIALSQKNATVIVDRQCSTASSITIVHAQNIPGADQCGLITEAAIADDA